MLERFQLAAEAVGATIKRFCAANDATEYLAQLAQGGVIATSNMPDELRQSLAGLPQTDSVTAETTLGVSFAEAGIAATGSLLLDLARPSERAATALPPLHAVFLKASTIVATLKDLEVRLTERLMGDGAGYLSITTGPSRTADIERVLTIGVHGPKELHILVLERD